MALNYDFLKRENHLPKTIHSIKKKMKQKQKNAKQQKQNKINNLTTLNCLAYTFLTQFLLSCIASYTTEQFDIFFCYNCCFRKLAFVYMCTTQCNLLYWTEFVVCNFNNTIMIIQTEEGLLDVWCKNHLRNIFSKFEHFFPNFKKRCGIQNHNEGTMGANNLCKCVQKNVDARECPNNYTLFNSNGQANVDADSSIHT